MLKPNRCGFGPKALPADFSAAFVGRTLGLPRGKGLQTWPDDIIIYTTQAKIHLVIVWQALEKRSATGLSVNVSKL